MWWMVVDLEGFTVMFQHLHFATELLVVTVDRMDVGFIPTVT